MGWQWCPKDPEIAITMVNGEEHTLRAYLFVPIEFLDRYERMNFLFEFPAGMQHIPYDTLYDEDDERVSFQYSDELNFGEDWMEVAVTGSVSGVPSQTAAKLMVILPWQAECRTIRGKAERISELFRVG